MGADDGTLDGSVGDEDRPAELLRPSQKPLATKPSAYAELGYVPVVPSPAGGVLIQGGEPPEAAPGLSDEGLVCIGANGRPDCRYYIAFLTDAEGHTKGMAQQRQIRRYCRMMSTASELMEIGESPIYACTARQPQDERSVRLIRDFELRQKKQAAELARESGELDM